MDSQQGQVSTPEMVAWATPTLAITATAYLSATPVIIILPTLSPKPTMTAIPTSLLSPTPSYTLSPSPTFSPTPIPAIGTNTPSPTPIATPTVWVDPNKTQLIIPKIGLDRPIVKAPIIDGAWQVDHLDQAVGHLARTAQPGQQGNVVLTAAQSSRSYPGPAPFTQLADLDIGDEVKIQYQGQIFRYQIDYLAKISTADIAVTYPSAAFKLTLLTNDLHGENPDTQLIAVGYLAQDSE
ncbi:MAG: sortase [Chloroflexota bacterium]